MTLDVPRTFKVNGSTGQRSRSQRDIKASKSAIIQARISYRRSNLVKITPEPSTTRYLSRSMAFKVIKEVIRSNIEIAIIPPRIAFKFRTVSSHHRRCTANVESQRAKVKVTLSKVKVTA